MVKLECPVIIYRDIYRYRDNLLLSIQIYYRTGLLTLYLHSITVTYYL